MAGLWLALAAPGAAVTAVPAGNVVLVDGADTTPDAEGCGWPANPCNTIQKGVEVSVNGDTVSVAPGVYLESVSVNKRIVLTGAGRDATVVDSGGSGRPLIAYNEARLGVSQLTLRGGRSLDGAGVNVNFSTLAMTDVLLTDNVAAVEGGGILVGFGSTAVLYRTEVRSNAASGAMGRGGGVSVAVDGRLTLIESRVEDNGAHLGAGIANQGNLSVVRSVIAGNQAGASGGGVLAIGATVIEDSRLADNKATGGDGGAVHAAARLAVAGATLVGNTAGGAGGGLHAAAGAYVTLRETTLQGNRAAAGGGASTVASARLEVERSLFVDNDANNGAGARNRGMAEFTNVTFSANRAATRGGGVLAEDGTLTLRNVTLTENRAGDSGGGVARTGGQLALGATLVARNVDLSPVPSLQPDCSGTVSSAGNNLVGDGTGCTGLDPAKNDLVGTDTAPIDPLLGPLADNGGRTDTHALLAGSPAIDAGAGCPNHDQRGAARPVDGDGDGKAVCDIGAFEAGVDMATRTPTPTATLTPTASATITPTHTATPSITPTPSPTVEGTLTPTPTRTRFPTVGPSPINTPGPSPTPSITPTGDTPEPPEPTETGEPEPTPEDPTPTVSVEPPDEPTPVPTETPAEPVEPSSTPEDVTATPDPGPEPTPPPAGSLFLPWLSR